MELLSSNQLFCGMLLLKSLKYPNLAPSQCIETTVLMNGSVIGIEFSLLFSLKIGCFSLRMINTKQNEIYRVSGKVPI